MRHVLYFEYMKSETAGEEVHVTLAEWREDGETHYILTEDVYDDTAYLNGPRRPKRRTLHISPYGESKADAVRFAVASFDGIREMYESLGANAQNVEPTAQEDEFPW